MRGTILDILSQRGKTTVVLQEGASRVCTLSFQCVELTQPGDTAIITLARRKVDDSKDQHPALDLRRELRGGGGALHRHAICGCRARDVDDGSDPTGMLCGR